MQSIREAGRVGIGVMATSSSAVQAELVGWAFSARPGTGCYIPMAHGGLADTPNVSVRDAFDRLGPVLADPSIAKVGHDLKFVTIACAREGVTLAGDRSGHDGPQLSARRHAIQP